MKEGRQTPNEGTEICEGRQAHRGRHADVTRRKVGSKKG